MWIKDLNPGLNLGPNPNVLGPRYGLVNPKLLFQVGERLLMYITNRQQQNKSPTFI